MALVFGQSIRKPWDTKTRSNKIFIKKSYDKVKKSDESVKYFYFDDKLKINDAINVVHIFEFVKGSFDKTNTKFLPNYMLHVDSLRINANLLDNYFKTDDFTKVVDAYSAFISTEQSQDTIKHHVFYNGKIQFLLEHNNEFNIYIEAIENCLTRFKLTDIFYLSYLGVLHISHGWPVKLTKQHWQKKTFFMPSDESGVKQIAEYVGYKNKEEIHRKSENDFIFIDICNNLEQVYETKIEAFLDMERTATSLTFTEAIDLLKEIDNAIINRFNVPEITTKHLRELLDNKDLTVESLFRNLFNVSADSLRRDYLKIIADKFVSDEMYDKYKVIVDYTVKRVDFDCNNGQYNNRNHFDFYRLMMSWQIHFNTNEYTTKGKLSYLGILYCYFISRINSLSGDDDFQRIERSYYDAYTDYRKNNNPRIIYHHNNLHLDYIKSRASRFVPSEQINYYTDSLLSQFNRRNVSGQQDTSNISIIKNMSRELYAYDNIANNTIPKTLQTLLKYSVVENRHNMPVKNYQRIVFVNDEIWDGLLEKNLTCDLNKKQFQLLTYIVKYNIMIPDDVNIAKNFIIMNMFIESIFGGVNSYIFSKPYDCYNAVGFSKLFESRMEGANDTLFLETDRCLTLPIKSNRGLDVMYAYVLDQDAFDAIEYYRHMTSDYENDVRREYDKQIENVYKIDGRYSKLDVLFDSF